MIPYILGVRDGWRGLSTGITYDNDPDSMRSRLYDHGRNLGEFARALLARIEGS